MHLSAKGIMSIIPSGILVRALLPITGNLTTTHSGCKGKASRHATLASFASPSWFFPLRDAAESRDGQRPKGEKA
jgi:hypothetical protein